MLRRDLVEKIAEEAYESVIESIAKGLEYSDVELGDGEEFMDALEEIRQDVQKKVAKHLIGGI